MITGYDGAGWLEGRMMIQQCITYWSMKVVVQYIAIQ